MSDNPTDPTAQNAVDNLTQGMSTEEKADLIREAAPDMSEEEVQAWAKRKNR